MLFFGESLKSVLENRSEETVGPEVELAQPHRELPVRGGPIIARNEDLCDKTTHSEHGLFVCFDLIAYVFNDSMGERVRHARPARNPRELHVVTFVHTSILKTLGDTKEKGVAPSGTHECDNKRWRFRHVVQYVHQKNM